MQYADQDQISAASHLDDNGHESTPYPTTEDEKKSPWFFVSEDGEEFFVRYFEMGYGLHQLRRTPAKFYESCLAIGDHCLTAGDISASAAMSAPWE